MNDAIPTPNPSAKRQADRTGSGGSSAEKAEAAVKMKPASTRLLLRPRNLAKIPDSRAPKIPPGRQYRGVALLLVNPQIVVLGERLERVGDEPLIQAEQQAAQGGNHAYDVDDGLVAARLGPFSDSCDIQSPSRLPCRPSPTVGPGLDVARVYSVRLPSRPSGTSAGIPSPAVVRDVRVAERPAGRTPCWMPIVSAKHALQRRARSRRRRSPCTGCRSPGRCACRVRRSPA